MSEKKQASVWRDLIEPGWREREAERAAKLLAAVPVRFPCKRGGCMAPEITCAAGEASPGECPHFPIPSQETNNG